MGKAHHAVLVTAQVPVVGLPMSGRIFEDTHTHGNHPFRDGVRVYTSEVLKVDGDLAYTRNTTYLIREPE